MNILRAYPLKRFQEILKLKNQILSLSFNQCYTPFGDKYFVHVNDESGSLMFQMMKDNSSQTWRVIDPAQRWIKEIESRLSDLIKSHD